MWCFHWDPLWSPGCIKEFLYAIGYFGASHLEQFRGSDDGVTSFEEALSLADPAMVLSGSLGLAL